MQIEIKQDIFYDTEKPYTEQEADVQAAISELINKQPDQKTEEPAGHWPRPLSQKWDYTEFIIERKYTYQHAATHPDNGLCSESITVIKGEPWHETDENIKFRMYQSFADNRRMLKYKPEFAMYVKNIEVYESATGIYMYFGFFNKGDRDFLESFNAVITERS
jgi:hypothetical protein